MPRIEFALLGALALCACHGKSQSPPTPTAKSAEIAAASITAPAATPAPRVVSTPDPSLCGVGKLHRFLNLLPTSTAKAEIARTAGDRTIRYISVTDVESLGPQPERLNVEIGADGRIKVFSCG